MLYILMLFALVRIYGQEAKLPQNIETNLKEKYPGAKIDDWWFEKELYSINFTFVQNSYTAVYDQNAEWQETSEIISDFDIPSNLGLYLKQNYPEGKISYCERVETREKLKFIRVNFFDKNQLLLIQCDSEGKNIKKVEDKVE